MKKLKNKSNINKIFILIIIFTGFAVFLNEGFLPPIHNKQEYYLQRSLSTAKAEEQADIFMQNGNYEKAETLLNIYLNVNKDDLDAIKKLEKIRAEISIKNFKTKESEETRTPRLKTQTGYKELLEIAQNYYDKEDYSSALYFASRANKVSGRRTEAENLIKRTEYNIANMGKSKKEKNLNLLFERKSYARDLIKGSLFIKAYYHLLETNNKYPEDKETENLLKETKENLKNIAFFRNEVDEFDLAPSSGPNYFINEKSTETIELIKYNSLAVINKIPYFKDLEIIRTNKGSKVFHIKCPYAKLLNNTILIHCIDSRNPEKSYSVEKIYKDGKEIQKIKLNRDLDLLNLINPKKSFEKLNINQLISVYAASRKYGFSQKPAALEIIMRFVKVFSYYCFFFTSILLGIILKKANKSFHFFKGIILLISLFYIINFVSSFYLYFNKLLFSFILIYNDIYMGIILLLLLNAVVILVLNAFAFRVIK